jgi:hypothetical protein
VKAMTVVGSPRVESRGSPRDGSPFVSGRQPADGNGGSLQSAPMAMQLDQFAGLGIKGPGMGNLPMESYPGRPRELLRELLERPGSFSPAFAFSPSQPPSVPKIPCQLSGSMRQRLRQPCNPYSRCRIGPVTGSQKSWPRRTSFPGSRAYSRADLEVGGELQSICPRVLMLRAFLALRAHPQRGSGPLASRERLSAVGD